MNNGIAYEHLVQRIFQAILRQEFVRNIDVQNNVGLKGIATNHQIDIFWEFEVGGINYKTVIEAKDWDQPVDQGEVMKFKARLDDLPDQPRGVMVSRSGFQAGACRFASSYGIVLYELREPTEHDLNGRVRVLDFTLVSYHSSTSCIRLGMMKGGEFQRLSGSGLKRLQDLICVLNPTRHGCLITLAIS